MTSDELSIRQKLKDDFEHYATRCLSIRTKEGGMVPLELNEAQRYIHQQLEKQLSETGKIRALLLKGRQQGVSTYTEARYYWKVTHRRGVKAFILTHEAESTAALFEMSQRYHDNCNELVKPSTGASSAKELYFDSLDSGYKVGTAGNKSVGRGTTIQYFHGCLAAGSLIIDAETTKLVPIENITNGFKVLTHTRKIANVSFVSNQQKECVTLKLLGLNKYPLKATLSHRFWTESGWKELSDISIGDSIGFPVATISNDIYMLPFRVSDEKRDQGGGSSESISDFVVLNYDIGRLLGLYLAEGTIKKQVSGKYSGVLFSVHDREVDRTLEWLRSSFNLYSSAKSKKAGSNNGSVVSVNGKSFAVFFELLCGSKDTKHIPINWHNMGVEFNRGLLHGYISGDGHCSPKDRRIRATSTRESIALGMRDIAASLGYGWASIEHKAAAIRYGRNEQEAFIFSLCNSGADKLAKELGIIFPKRKQVHTRGTLISNGYAWIQIQDISLPELMTVYDLEVDHIDHSYCTIHAASHNSEVAFWPHASEHAKGILQAVPDARDTEVILESTGNGIGNYFHQQWQLAERGESEYQAIFVPWYWQKEYTKPVSIDFKPTDEEQLLADQYGLNHGQLQFRRSKIADLSVDGIDGTVSFKQEYPFNAIEAFQVSGGDTLISPECVMNARQQSIEGHGGIIIGVDPARYGEDRTSIIYRQGRKAYNLTSYSKKNTMEVAGIVHTLIEKDSPAQVAVDVGGLGAGVVDRLIELGHGDIIVPVNAGSSPLDQDKYKNRRAEMWGELKNWLNDIVPVQVPDSDSLHSDLCAPFYSYDSNSRLVIERKEEMRKRGVRSPDEADALCLTFAEPIRKAKATYKTINTFTGDTITGY